MRAIEAKRGYLERPDGMLVGMCAEDVAVYPLPKPLPHLVLVVERGVQDANGLTLPEALHVPVRGGRDLGSVLRNAGH